MTFLYDIVNLEFVLILYFLAVYYLRLDALRSFLVLGHLITIFLINDVLIEKGYWPDQKRYLWIAAEIREQLVYLKVIPQFWDSLRIVVPSFIFAFSPIPFINSVQSIAMINFLLYLLSFVYLRKKGVSSNSVDFFFLLYPSFLLYSSIALRETLITLFMILSLYFVLVEEKKLVGFIFSLPLTIMKIQNFLILMLTYIIYVFLKKGSIQRYLIFFGAGLLVLFFGNRIPQINFFLETIEYYRWNLISENFGYNWDFMANYDYQPFEVGFSMIPLLVKSFFYMLFKPFPWEATNLVQMIQSVENIFIVALIVWVLKQKVLTPIIKRKLVFLNLLLIFSMTIYGLVTFNFGTASRFRFPFIVVYLVFYLYFLRSDKIISRQYTRGYSSTLSIS
tara:strand:- start:663 stop:1838 length:1176 start_codon:yes stop_codon:yes gene_type:complete